MSLLTAHPRLRWTAPIAAAVLAVAGTALVGGRADADTDLQPRSAAQLLVDVQQAVADGAPGMSGTVVQTANLGLPELPLPGGGGAADLGATISGTHTWRVWYAGPEQARLALVGSLGESDVIRNGRDLWVWSSQDKAATHYTLPEHAPGSPTHSTTAPTPLPSTPQDAAAQALAAIEPTTEVSTPGPTTVAGRAAYELVLTPRSEVTLVDRVTIAVDAAELVPVQVQVFSTRMSEPALEVGFTSVDFTTPDPRQFVFTPPPGTEVTEGGQPSAPVGGDAALPSPDRTPGTGPDAGSDGDVRPAVVGTGWETVVVSPAPSDNATEGPLAGLPPELGAVLGQLPSTSGSWGSGRVLEGTLFTAVVTDNGRLAIGAVGADAVYEALATTS